MKIQKNLARYNFIDSVAKKLKVDEIYKVPEDVSKYIIQEVLYALQSEMENCPYRFKADGIKKVLRIIKFPSKKEWIKKGLQSKDSEID